MGKNKLSASARRKGETDFEEIWRLLESRYPDAQCALKHENAWQLLIATILSAQCTDKMVNSVTPPLFERFPSVEEMAQADLGELMGLIRKTGFYRNKAKNIRAACQLMVEEFGGRVPDKMSDLLRLPGVARKTANVVLWNAFGKNVGVVVDTHVKRIAFRLGWTTEEKNVGKIEKDLMALCPRERWGMLSHLLIDLGRDVCVARKPKCGKCELRGICVWKKNVVDKL